MVSKAKWRMCHSQTKVREKSNEPGELVPSAQIERHVLKWLKNVSSTIAAALMGFAALLPQISKNFSIYRGFRFEVTTVL